MATPKINENQCLCNTSEELLYITPIGKTSPQSLKIIYFSYFKACF